ncbi:hypothetical protein LCGC14_2958350, partial [marine sediment metagenome]
MEQEVAGVMHCPKCRHKKTYAYDSRPNNRGATVRRRRECAECRFRFSTTEVRVLSRSQKN